MASRGFLIRFIDIGLIVLFGFLMISDIEASSRVELGGATDALNQPVEPEDDQGFIVVEIEADGAFVVGERAVDAARVRVRDAASLEEAIAILRRTHEAAGLETMILIEPHPASAVQRTVDVMDVSDRLGLGKSLSMDIDVVRAP